MTRAFTTWTVLPHGKLTPLADNMLTVVGDIPMPVGNMHRRMTVVRLADRRLVVFSAIALDEDEMAEIEAFGTPAYLIVPGDHHRLDAGIWKTRYPQIIVVAPAGAREKIEAVAPVDATSADFGDPAVRLIDVPGTRAHEFALEVDGGAGDGGGLTLVINDLIGNIRDAHGFGGWLLKLMGFAGDEPHVPGPIKAHIVDDKRLLAEQLERWADKPRLKRIVVSHGEIIEDDPQGALRQLAQSLR